MEEKKSSWFLWVIGTGGLVGAVLSTWLSPQMISWYFTPPANFGVSCVEPINWALKRFQWAQLGGIIAGALIAMLLYFKFKKSDEPTTGTGEPL